MGGRWDGDSSSWSQMRRKSGVEDVSRPRGDHADSAGGRSTLAEEEDLRRDTLGSRRDTLGSDFSTDESTDAISIHELSIRESGGVQGKDARGSM